MRKKFRNKKTEINMETDRQTHTDGQRNRNKGKIHRE